MVGVKHLFYISFLHFFFYRFRKLFTYFQENVSMEGLTKGIKTGHKCTLAVKCN